MNNIKIRNSYTLVYSILSIFLLVSSIKAQQAKPENKVDEKKIISVEGLGEGIKVEVTASIDLPPNDAHFEAKIFNTGDSDFDVAVLPPVYYFWPVELIGPDGKIVNPTPHGQFIMHPDIRAVTHLNFLRLKSKSSFENELFVSDMYKLLPYTKYKIKFTTARFNFVGTKKYVSASTSYLEFETGAVNKKSVKEDENQQGNSG